MEAMRKLCALRLEAIEMQFLFTLIPFHIVNCNAKLVTLVSSSKTLIINQLSRQNQGCLRGSGKVGRSGVWTRAIG